MFIMNLRLINMLTILTVLIIISLVLDYCHFIRRPLHIGLVLGIAGIILALGLSLEAVLPENHFYGTVYSQGGATKKTVVLTFDDGPCYPNTVQILDILKENDIKATFFVIGRNAESNPNLLRRINLEGHQIGNHTYDHVDLLKVSRTKMVEDIKRTNQIIKMIIGNRPHIIRPPHGFRDPAVLQAIQSCNMEVVEWSVMSEDWMNPGTEKIVSRTLGQVKNESIILLHDGCSSDRSQTVEALRKIITELKNQGYKLVNVDDILVKAGGK